VLAAGGGERGSDAAVCALSDVAALLRADEHASVHEVTDSAVLPGA
jgi:hypothetical protein